MKHSLLKLAALAGLLATLNPQPSTLFAQGTAFSVQGRLNNNGSPANGLFDVQVSVFDAAGNAVSPTNTFSSVTVSNGIFTVTPDFGTGVFTGASRSLQIAFRTAGSGAFSTISPRQPVVAAPYAIFAGTASNMVSGSVVKSLNSLKDDVALVGNNGVTVSSSGNTLTISGSGGGGGGTNSPWSTSGSSVYYTGGNVGIDVASPSAKLEVRGDWDGQNGALKLRGNKPTLRMEGTILQNYGNWLIHVGESGPHSPGNLEFWRGAAAFAGQNPAAWDFSMALTTDGSLSFGSRLGQHLSLWGDDSVSGGSYGLGMQAQTLYSRCGGTPGDGFVWYKGGVPNPNKRHAGGGQMLMTLDGESGLYISGKANVCTLTIRGGCDLAEPFPMNETQIEKGSVVVIDEANPGQLKRSTRAYDTRVAGIVSGANGINPGISLKQEGALDQGENVALTGRVYVQADASFGAIKPGDLLTTSDTPGHAMKVTDHTRAQGAVLGKAMSALNEGRGTVLVLVTLQ